MLDVDVCLVTYSGLVPQPPYKLLYCIESRWYSQSRGLTARGTVPGLALAPQPTPISHNTSFV